MKSKKGLLIIIAILSALCLMLIFGINYWRTPTRPQPFDENIIQEFFISENFYFTLNDPSYRSIHSDDFWFYDNILNIRAELGVPKSELEAVARDYNAEITSYRKCEFFGDEYTFTFSRRFTFEELELLATELEELDIIYWAVIAIVVDAQPRTLNAPNDPRWDSWNENNPRGNNWGFEAINTLSAWQYREKMDYVNILVLDTGFYNEHEDLELSNYNAVRFAPHYHGTHVAGIIGATFDNGIGISGVAPNSRLRGEPWFSDASMLMNIIEYYIVNDNVKVINISMGDNTTELSASRGQQHAIDTLQFRARYYELRLRALLYRGFEFVICVSAGNQHRRINDIYEPFARIQHEEVRNRIIIVGATQRNGNLANYSQRGELMDISAPGHNIYSTLRVNANGISRYGNRNGTSMSAPFVSGVATMIFGINPDLTGAEVKRIIVDTAEGRHYTINAHEAVNQAIMTITTFGGAEAGTQTNVPPVNVVPPVITPPPQQDNQDVPHVLEPESIDIQPFVGRNFNNSRYLLGNLIETGVDGYWGDPYYVFENGLVILTFDNNINEFNINYRDVANRSAFNYSGIDGASTNLDVRAILGNPIRYTSPDGWAGDGVTLLYVFGTQESLDFGGNLIIAFDSNGMVVSITRSGHPVFWS